MTFSKRTRITITAAALSLLPTVTLADISYTREISVSASGALNTFSSNSTITTHISNDRARTEVRSEGIFPGETDTDVINIVRLDKGLTWQLDPTDKSYQEISMAEARAEIANFKDQVQSLSGGNALPIQPDNCEWSEARIQARATNEKERIAGLRATRHILTMSQTCKDISSGNSCNVEWTMEPWMSTKVRDGGEVNNYYQALADQLSMDYLIPQMAGASQMLLAMFPNRWENLLDELEQFEGYPVRNIMTMKLSGPLCMNAQGAPIAQGGGLIEDAGTEAYNAAVDSAGGQTGSAVGSAATGAMGQGVGAAIGGAAVGAATGELVGGLTSMFKKKKKPAQVQQAPAPTDLTLFRVKSEVTRWEDKSIPATEFELPAGWTAAN